MLSVSNMSPGQLNQYNCLKTVVADIRETIKKETGIKYARVFTEPRVNGIRSKFWCLYGKPVFRSLKTKFPEVMLVNGIPYQVIIKLTKWEYRYPYTVTSLTVHLKRFKTKTIKHPGRGYQKTIKGGAR